MSFPLARANATLRVPQPAPEVAAALSPSASGAGSNAQLPSGLPSMEMPTSVVKTAETAQKFTRYNPNSYSAQNLFLKDYLSQHSASKAVKEEFEAAWLGLDTMEKQEYEARNKAEKEHRKAARAPPAA